MKKLVTLILSAVMLFTAVFAVPVSAEAATGRVKVLKVVSVSTNSVKLKWKKVKGAKSYKVYYSTKKGSGYKLAKTVNKKSAIVKKLKDNKTYYFKVKAVKNGKTGSASPVKSATTKKVWGKITGVKVRRYGILGFYSWEDGGGGFECMLFDFNKVADADGYQVAYYMKDYEYDVTFKYIKNNRFRYGHQEDPPIFQIRAYKKTSDGKTVFGPWNKPKIPKNCNYNVTIYLEDYEATYEKDYESVE